MLSSLSRVEEGGRRHREPALPRLVGHMCSADCFEVITDCEERDSLVDTALSALVSVSAEPQDRRSLGLWLAQQRWRVGAVIFTSWVTIRGALRVREPEGCLGPSTPYLLTLVPLLAKTAEVRIWPAPSAPRPPHGI